MPATAAAVEIDRAEVNRANAQHSTGPRTEAGKQRSSQNALRHGLTARSAVLPSEDPAAYQQHLRQFMDEYQPATATETQMVQQLADTSWRINRIPMLEADILARVEPPDSPTPSPEPPAFDIVDAHRLLANLGCNSTRSPANSKRRSNSFARSKLDRRRTRAAATSKTPPTSTNSINTKAFPGSPPIMASFFQKNKWNVTRNA